jgi:hypothetical protein
MVLHPSRFILTKLCSTCISAITRFSKDHQAMHASFANLLLDLGLNANSLFIFVPGTTRQGLRSSYY